MNLGLMVLGLNEALVRFSESFTTVKPGMNPERKKEIGLNALRLIIIRLDVFDFLWCGLNFMTEVGLADLGRYFRFPNSQSNPSNTRSLVYSLRESLRLMALG